MYLKNLELKNKTALVTGAGKGIGKACAIALAEAGADLILVSRTQKDLSTVQKTIRKLKRKCTSIICDVSDYDEVKKLFSQLKRLDILVNNAGITRDKFFHKMGPEDWSAVINTNLNSMFNITRSVIEKMRAKKFGRIISIGSINGLKGQVGQSNYSAAKAGIIGFSKAIALEK